MKNKPLAVQIWVVLAGTSLAICILLLAALPPILRTFFTKETYAAIKQSQELIATGAAAKRLLDEISLAERQQELQNARSVSHLVLTADGRILPQLKGPPAIAEKIRKEAALQTAAEKRYEAGKRAQRLYYIIRKITVGDRNIALISYMWDTNQRELTATLYRRLILLMLVITAVSWLPAIWLSRFLSRPLVALQQHVRRIADRDWKEPIRTDRRDEIGQLGTSIERMRAQLVKQDENQQSMLQSVSHELKTPVMVIHSYAQAILDGVYPKGDLEGSVKVIEAEAVRLDKRVRDLLYYTKLHYLSAEEPEREPVALASLLQGTAERLRWRKPELEWTFDLGDAVVSGDAGQLNAAIENLLDNSMRYARTRIAISLITEGTGAEKAAVLRIANDGPAMDEEKAARLFEPFQKGSEGEFGLGLAIVRRIAAMHNGTVKAVNEPPGVAFYITLPAAAGAHGD